jgi:hypothetical protein
VSFIVYFWILFNFGSGSRSAPALSSSASMKISTLKTPTKTWWQWTKPTRVSSIVYFWIQCNVESGSRSAPALSSSASKKPSALKTPTRTRKEEQERNWPLLRQRRMRVRQRKKVWKTRRTTRKKKPNSAFEMQGYWESLRGHSMRGRLPELQRRMLTNHHPNNSLSVVNVVVTNK